MNKYCLALLFQLCFGCVMAQNSQRVLVVKPKTEQQKTIQKKTMSERDYWDLNLQNFSLGFVQNTLKEKDGMKLKSNFGLMASYTRMYLLNPTPSVFNYGFDIVYADLNYVNYKLQFKSQESVTTEHIHQAELGVQGGFAMLLAPADGMTIKAYVRYAPTYSLLKDKEKWHHSYGNYIVAGANFSFKHIGLGGEFRYGTCKNDVLNVLGTADVYTDMNEYFNVDQNNSPATTSLTGNKRMSYTNTGFRVFVSYHF